MACVLCLWLCAGLSESEYGMRDVASWVFELCHPRVCFCLVAPVLLGRIDASVCFCWARVASGFAFSSSKVTAVSALAVSAVW